MTDAEVIEAVRDLRNKCWRYRTLAKDVIATVTLNYQRLLLNAATPQAAQTFEHMMYGWDKELKALEAIDPINSLSVPGDTTNDKVRTGGQAEQDSTAK